MGRYDFFCRRKKWRKPSLRRYWGQFTKVLYKEAPLFDPADLYKNCREFKDTRPNIFRSIRIFFSVFPSLANKTNLFVAAAQEPYTISPSTQAEKTVLHCY